MAKARTSFLCEECGATQAQWMGRCPECNTWDSLVSYNEPAPEASATADSGGGVAAIYKGTDSDPESGTARPLHEVDLTEVPRMPTGIAEVDRVLGGGFVPGSSVLLGGDPGIGKSTLLMQVAGALGGTGGGVLYASSEESAAQVRLRADRLGLGRDEGSGKLFVLAETDLTRVLKEAVRLKTSLLILDSIQMAWLGGAAGAGGDRARGGSGAAAQLRRCATELALLAKKTGMAVVIVGHVTKDGALAGPKLLEHLVDVVLAFEGDQHHRHRILRGIKNRFGSTQEIGLFQMTSDGLEPVDEDLVRLDSEALPAPGAVIVPTLAGSRCLLAEIQGLTATGFLGSAKRRAAGVDAARLAMLIAVLEKHGGLRLADQDVFVSVAGGLRVLEPGVDLATALAIAGAHYGRSLEPGTAVFGEVTLAGAIRPAAGVAQRVSEALRRGARRIILPAGQADALPPAERAHLHEVARLVDALALLETVPTGSAPNQHVGA